MAKRDAHNGIQQRHRGSPDHIASQETPAVTVGRRNDIEGLYDKLERMTTLGLPEFEPEIERVKEVLRERGEEI